MSHPKGFVIPMKKVRGNVSLLFLKVYDSFGKMGSSVKDGNVNQPGSPQQCRSAIGPSFSTQYCQVFLKQVNANKNLHDGWIVSYREKLNIFFPAIAGSNAVFCGYLCS